MPNVISGYISGNYGGPRSCDSRWSFSSPGAAVACATNTGDCSHTVVMGTSGPSAFDSGNFVFSDSIHIFKNRSYTGPESCTSDNYCAESPCFETDNYTSGSFYVNPGHCVQLEFIVYSRASNDLTEFCREAVTLVITGATAPNLGILTGDHWYPPSQASTLNCCAQVTQLCEPVFQASLPYPNAHHANLTYKLFNDERLSYLENTDNFCCSSSLGCASPTKSTSPVYSGEGSTCIEFYSRDCKCPTGATASRQGTVAAPVIGPKYASYFYCADQPCGALIQFSPGNWYINGVGRYYASTDTQVYLNIYTSEGCGTGCVGS